MISSWIKSAVRTKTDRRPQFEQKMRESSRQAYSLALRLTGNVAEAEDLVQETYLRAFRFFNRYDDSLPFTSWLYRIMTNLHIDTVRRRKRLTTVSIDQAGDGNEGTWEFADNAPTAAESMMARSLEEPMRLALQSMNAEFRLAVVLSDVEGLSYEEVAEIMDTSVGTVRSRIHRGRKQIREYLETRHPEYAEVNA
jgi:RNA polymerase sigma-70 factor (ECF subfamily)